MKNIMKILVLGALVAFSVPAHAQQDNAWSTGGVAGSGSAYSSQITPVGAETPDAMAITTVNAAPNRGSARKVGPSDPGYKDVDNYPIGSVWALLVFAAFGGAVVLRRRKGQTE